jgi:hypothetical protein
MNGARNMSRREGRMVSANVEDEEIRLVQPPGQVVGGDER